MDDNPRLIRYGPLLVLTFSLLVTIVGWRFTDAYVHDTAARHFQAATHLIESRIQARMESYVLVLRGARGLFSNSQEVTRGEWHGYVGALNLDQYFRGIQGVGFARHLRPADLAEHVRQVRAEGFPDYSVRPAGEREEYTSITYLEPFDERNRRAFGYDMFSNPARRAAMERARDTGVATLSGKVELVQEFGDDKQAGVLLYLPVYVTPEVPATLLERREALLGYVYSPFRTTDLIRGVLLAGAAKANFQVFDGPRRNDEALLYDSDPLPKSDIDQHRPKFVSTSTIEVAGHPWTIDFSSTPVFDARLSFHLSTGALIGGLVLSTLLFVISWMLLKARQRAVVLAERTADADQANRAKSAFLATMSHEIRTPINGVIGMVEVLARSRPAEHQVEAIKIIRDSAFVLLSLIDDILDFSKIEAGRLEFERAPVCLAEIVEGVCGSLIVVAEKKGVDLYLFIDPHVPGVIWADDTRLRQVVYNLIGNAIKFSGDRPNQRGRVEVRMEMLDGETPRVSLSFADNGIGMAPETLETLFTTFNQAETSTTRRFGGTGLGLAIAHRLVELMAGDFTVESHLGAGSIFSIVLPIEPVDDTDGRPMPDLGGLDAVLVEGAVIRTDDLRVYLESAGARVRLAQDLDEAARLAADQAAPVVIIQDLGRKCVSIPFDELRAAFSGVPDPRYLLITWGRRRGARLEHPDAVTLDGDAMAQSAFLRAVAVAAGRASPDVFYPEADVSQMDEQIVPPSIAEARAKGQLILVAEDDDVNQKVILRQLRLLGYAAELAGDGEEALRLWRTGGHALLLTDIHMPRMDGYALTEAIRHAESGRARLPILALTANALRGESYRAEAAGMDEYLTKPLRLDALAAALEKWGPSMKGPTASGPSSGEVPETPGRVAVDVAVLKDLVGDDAGILLGLLADYLASARRLAGELRTASGVADAQRVGLTAHQLKSSSRAVGALALGDLCAELENAGKANDKVAMGESMVRFEVGFTAVQAEILDLLEGRRGWDNEVRRNDENPAH